MGCCCRNGTWVEELARKSEARSCIGYCRRNFLRAASESPLRCPSWSLWWSLCRSPEPARVGHALPREARDEGRVVRVALTARCELAQKHVEGSWFAAPEQG